MLPQNASAIQLNKLTQGPFRFFVSVYMLPWLVYFVCLGLTRTYRILFEEVRCRRKLIFLSLRFIHLSLAYYVINLAQL